MTHLLSKDDLLNYVQGLIGSGIHIHDSSIHMDLCGCVP